MRYQKLAVAAVTWCALAPFALAQTPRINHVMPMGGQAGTTIDLSVTGSDLKDVTGLHFNFPGVKVETGTSEAVDPGKMPKGKQPQPQNLTTNRFKVTIPANAPLGIQDVRIVTKAGISNPRAFVISDHKDVVENEPNNDVPQAQKIDINTTVNGVITTPTDVDYFVFTGKKGQRVVVSCASSSIDSRLPAALQVYNADGALLANNRGYAGNDALVDVTLPADGNYFVRVFSFSYTQGGVDNFYRLTVSTAPWIDAVFPPVVVPGKETQVTVYGRNLPGGKLDPSATFNERTLEKAVITVKPPSDAKELQRLAISGFVMPPSSMLDGFEQRIKNEAGQSNPYLLTYAPALVVLDNGDNDEPEKAQAITLPCVIAGRIEKKSDRDWYRFSAKKGEVYTIEGVADRIGSPVELVFQLRDSTNNLWTEQKESTEILSPQFFTRSEDPQKYRFTVPADGEYKLVVTSRDAFTLFGPRHLYTIRIAPEEPDFRLVAMPTATVTPDANTVHQNSGAAFNVYVWRFGTFAEEITLAGDSLPPGVGVKPQVISGNQKQAVVVVHAEGDAKPWDGAIKLVGTATVGGKKLTREVRAATISWPVQQANNPTITRLDRELVLAVRDQAPYTLALGAEKIKVNQGEKVSIPVKVVPGENFKTAVQVAAFGGPPGLVPQNVSITPGQGGTVTLDTKGGAPIPPGNYTVFLRGQTQPINPKNPQPPPKGAPPNIVQTSMPVTVTIVPKQLGKLTATPANAKVSAGKNVEVTVRLARQFDLPLSLKVEAILPPNVKGVEAKPATINAGEEETKLVFMIAPDAAVGPAPSITIRATAMFNGDTPVAHETKLTLNIAK